MLFWLLSVALAADCDAPVKPDQLSAYAEDALFAFATMDEDGFVTAADRAGAELACLDEPLLPPQAASLHRLEALRAFLDGKDAEALASFRAARRIEPDYRLSSKIAPEGGPLHDLYEQAGDSANARMVPVELPDGVLLWVDGSSATSRPGDQPAILQLLAGGGVTWSARLTEGRKVPSSALSDAGKAVSSAAPPPPPPPPEPDPLDVGPEDTLPDDLVMLDEPEPERARKPRPLPTEPAPSGASSSLTPALGLGAGAVVSFGAAAGLRSRFEQTPSENLYYATNGAHAASIALGATATALLVKHLVQK